MKTIQPDIRPYVYIGGILSKNPLIQKALYSYYMNYKEEIIERGNFNEVNSLSSALLFSTGPESFDISKFTIINLPFRSKRA